MVVAMKADTLTYLPHLDGLRALAFAYVLFFHFRVFSATGGYLGVDIFLVLSGFLMTRIILRDISNGTFSMMRFMTRRFWRLYPLLLVTVTLTLLTSLLVFTPKLHLAVGKSSAAALLFSSNLFFLATVGYFDISTELKPLLHTWSLSLEEQFYFVWPAFLYIIYRSAGCSKRSLSLAFSAATLTSFTYAWYLGYRRASLTFFSLPTRIFEFTVGALLSTHYDHLAIVLERAKLHHVTAVLGAILVNYPVFTASVSNLPGFSSLTTLFGTSLLIITPNSILSEHILASPLVRFVGALSYSGYLVHWPIWVFSLFIFDTAGTGGVNKTAMFALTFALAYLLHKTVENPFRHKRSPGKSSFVFILLSFTLMLSLGSVATSGYSEARSGPTRYRLFARSWRYNQLSCNPLPSSHPVFKQLNGEPPPQHCYIGPAAAAGAALPISAVVVGSSFANHLIPAFRLLALQHGTSYLLLHHESCPLLADESHPWPWVTVSCYIENQKRMGVLRALPPYRLLLADHWHLRFSVLRRDKRLTDPSQGAFQYFRGACARTTALGHNVTVLGDPPVIGERLFEAAQACHMLRDMRVRRFVRWVLGYGHECATRFWRPKDQGNMNAEMKRFFAEDDGVHRCGFLDQFPGFCGAQRCILTVPPSKTIKPPGADVESLHSNMLYWEGVHLNNQGAWHASQAIGALLSRDGKR